jgi:propionyl-CoA carboxylase alpha chain
MEARICAEDPARGFMPSTGIITRYAEPRGNTVRVDSGVKTGSKVGVYYDSMLAKVICYGKDREAARTGLVDALNGYHIEGVVTNIDFANSVLCHPEYAKCNITTGFIERYYDGNRPLCPPEDRHLALAGLAATVIYHVRKAAVRDSLQPLVSLIGGRRDSGGSYQYNVRSEKEVFAVRIEGALPGRPWTVNVNDNKYVVEIPDLEFYRRRLKLTINGRVHRFRLRVERSFIYVAFSGITRVFEVYTPKEWALMQYMPTRTERAAGNVLVCPMPGLVVDVLAKKGERVFRGQNLVVLESMKMESGVASPMDGIIAEVRAAVGQAVEVGDVLIRFNP